MDALKGYVEGNIDNRNEFFMNRFMTDRKRFGKYLFESISLQNMPPRVIEIFAVLGLFILIVINKWLGNTDSSYLLTIGAFMAAAYKIIPGIVKIINVSGQMRAYEFSVDDLINDKEHNERKDMQPSCNIQSFVIKDIAFSYDGSSVLNNFSFENYKRRFYWCHRAIRYW
ncbi:MAG: hypothetical protein WDN26_04110 [Chitinophagaceae bacterium]